MYMYVRVEVYVYVYIHIYMYQNTIHWDIICRLTHIHVYQQCFIITGKIISSDHQSDVVNNIAWEEYISNYVIYALLLAIKQSVEVLTCILYTLGFI